MAETSHHIICECPRLAAARSDTFRAPFLHLDSLEMDRHGYPIPPTYTSYSIPLSWTPEKLLTFLRATHLVPPSSAPPSAPPPPTAGPPAAPLTSTLSTQQMAGGPSTRPPLIPLTTQQMAGGPSPYPSPTTGNMVTSDVPGSISRDRKATT
jgi:hypothetical protein